MIGRTLGALVLVAVPACAGAPRSTEVADGSDAPSVDAVQATPVDAEAPQDCGFEPGTKLIFAGRSTTSQLQVQEVIGDPMSNDPADIYITFDEVDSENGPAREVCAIYVTTPGFVELTLAPVGWDPINGRPPATATPEPTPAPSMPDATVLPEEAVAAARAAVPEAADWEVNGVQGLRAGDDELHAMEDWAADLDAGHPVWVVLLWNDDRGAMVYVDAVTGAVLEVQHVIS